MSRSWPRSESPFVFEGPLPGSDVVGRDDEVASLVEASRAGRSIALVAPRRYGKTSLLNRVADDLRGSGDASPVLVDLYGTLSLADLAVRLERAYSRDLHGPLRRVVARFFSASGLGLSLSAGGIGLEFQRQPRTDPLPALHALLDVPTRVARDRRLWIVLDEFQAVMTVESAEAIIRSHIQHHRERATYVFAGSEPAMLERLFSDRARPFYGQAETRRLGRLSDASLTGIIQGTFAATGRSTGDALAHLLRTAQGHPQRAMLLAHDLWLTTASGATATDADWLTAFDHAMERIRLECEMRYRALSVNQQRVLRALAGWGTPYAKDAHVQVGLAEGNVAAVVRQLRASGDLEEAAEGRYRCVDPLLEAWVNRQFRRAR